MSTEEALRARSGSACELCGAAETLGVYEVPPTCEGAANDCVLICAACKGQIEDPATLNANHWRGLSDSMWSQVPAVQVMAWRMLKRLSSEAWAHDLLEMFYLDEATQAWAEAAPLPGADSPPAGAALRHRDSNGAVLAGGDIITLTKDLSVKGAGFTAKRGTAVRGITLIEDNAHHIEGRINGQRIVILTEFVRKST
jgi:protein PhnA